jgi:hypothetical protein
MLSGCLEDTEKLTSHLLVNMKNKILQSHESLMCNIKYNSPTFFNLEFFPCIALLHVWNRKLVFSHLYIYVLRMWKAHLFAHFHPVYIVPRKQNKQTFESPRVPLSIYHFYLPFFYSLFRKFNPKHGRQRVERKWFDTFNNYT